MRTLRTNFDRQESRRDRRYALPILKVTMGGEEHLSDNWSLGGFMLTGPLGLEVGATVSGTVKIEGSDGFAFTAEVVRKEPDTGSFGFHFRDMTPLAVSTLDRALARRLVSRKRP